MSFRLIALILLIITGFAMRAAAETQRYDFEGFTDIEVTDGLPVAIAVGGPFAITAEAVTGTLERLEVDQSGQTLTLSMGPGASNDDIRVLISLPELLTIQARAGSAVEVRMEEGQSLGAIASGGASLEVATTLIGRAELFAASGASLRIDGLCDGLSAESASGSSLDASGFSCGAVKADALSGSSLKVNASQSAIVNARGGSSAYLTGSARMVASQTSGGSSFLRN